MLKRMIILNNNNQIDKNTIHIAIKTIIIIITIKINIKILLKITGMFKTMMQK